MRLQQGQTALITGAASGIGAATARSLAARGLRLILADVEAAPLAALVDALRDGGAAAEGITLDVADRSGTAAALAQVAAPDVVVANAGVVGPRLPLWEQAQEDWDWVLGVNLHGVVAVLGAVVPGLVARGSGHVAITASTAAFTPVRGGGNGPYAASKHALLGVADVLREDLRDVAPAVGVTVLCPGPVDTRIRDAARNRPGRHMRGEITPTPAFTHAVPSISAAEAAAVLIDAIEVDAPLAFPNPGSLAEARRAVAGLLDRALWT